MGKYAKLLTREGEALLEARHRDPELQPWDVYPRPQLARDSFLCLNGTWDFCVTDNGAMPGSAGVAESVKVLGSARADVWREILVPFAPQSILSGICEDIPDGSYLWYRRMVTLPCDFIRRDPCGGYRLILNIDAADQITTVYVNGREIGTCRSGYHRASYDLTAAVSGIASQPEPDTCDISGSAVASDASFELMIRVYDRLADRVMPYGKQSLHRGGMWYTPVSGIWQTVWLECVPDEYVRSIDYTVSDCGDTVSVAFDITGIDCGTLELDPLPADNASESAAASSEDVLPVTVPIADGKAELRLTRPRRWAPDDPFLYHFVLRTDHDTVRSYFAIRTISVCQIGRIPRICLNGKPVFLNGLLDQGYWSDGIFTPAAPGCFADEIAKLKELGFNTLRKHIKVEPDLFYYECDRSGILVIQDMVNNGEYRFLRDTLIPTAGFLHRDDARLNTNKAAREEFKRAMALTVSRLRMHPSIILWTIFNEGWGQYDGSALYQTLRSLDNSRLIDTASGWYAGPMTDIESRHVYFRKVRIPRNSGIGAVKPLLVTEFGGHSYTCTGHCYNTRSAYGYGRCRSREALVRTVRKLYEGQILPLIPEGLCGAIYTQVSDVEDEVNGIFTYDRRVQKLLPEDIRDLSGKMQKLLVSRQPGVVSSEQ